MNRNETGFEYQLPQNYEPRNLNLSPEIKAVLAKNAIGTKESELLVGEVGSIEIEKLKDGIEAQSEASLLAATTIIDQLNTLRQQKDKLKAPTIEEFRYILDEKIEEWQKNGSIEYCRNYIEQNNGKFNLIATPNATITSKELIFLAKEFVKAQAPSEPTYFNENFYNLYSPQELSGSQTTNINDDIIPPVRLSLIPTSPSLNLANIEQQRIMLQEMQYVQPNIKVPSPLDVVSNWYTLATKGYPLNDSSAITLTYVRHFNMEPKDLDGWSDVPDSYIYNGEYHMSNSYIVYSGRVAIG